MFDWIMKIVLSRWFSSAIVVMVFIAICGMFMGVWR